MADINKKKLPRRRTSSGPAAVGVMHVCGPDNVHFIFPLCIHCLQIAHDLSTVKERIHHRIVITARMAVGVVVWPTLSGSTQTHTHVRELNKMFGNVIFVLKLYPLTFLIPFKVFLSHTYEFTLFLLLLFETFLGVVL